MAVENENKLQVLVKQVSENLKWDIEDLHTKLKREGAKITLNDLYIMLFTEGLKVISNYNNFQKLSHFGIDTDKAA